MIEYNEDFDKKLIIPFFIQPESDSARRQVQFSHKLIVNLFEKGYSPCKQEFPEIRKNDKSLTNVLSPYTPV